MFPRLLLPAAIAMFGPLTLGMRADAQSVHPFYEKDDLVFRQELIGKWEVEGVPIEFSAVGENTYGVRVQADAQNQFCFLAHLFRVDGRYFLDGQISGMKLNEPANPSVQEDAGNYGAANILRNESANVIPSDSCFDMNEGVPFLNRAHGLIFLQWGTDPDKLDAASWNETWLPDMAKLEKLKVPYTKDDADRILLLGDRSEMREFVISLPLEAFDRAEHLTRAKPQEATRKTAPGATNQVREAQTRPAAGRSNGTREQTNIEKMATTPQNEFRYLRDTAQRRGEISKAL